MKKIILILLLIFIIGCAEQIKEKEDTELTKPVEEVEKSEPEEPIEELEETAPVQEKAMEEPEETPKPTPSSYHVENVPYYGELNFCYGASAMMLLMYNGFSEEQAQEYRTVVKTGPGGPPDIFMGFHEYDLIDKVKIGYSKNYVKEYADFYSNEILENPEQTILFDSKNEAFEYLKRLISSDIAVIAIIHDGNHYAVITGYDDDYIYTNDPGFDNEWNYKIDSDPNLKQRRIPVSNFLDEWSIKGFEGGGIGFPGDYGMIWLEEETQTQSIQDEDTKEDTDDIWRSEIVDDDGWVGIDSSIAVDANGNPHISHYDQGNRNLKYAYWTGDSWKKEVIDSAGDVGEESGIAVDSKGNVHVSYIDVTNGALKYAKREGSLWNTETVDKKSRAHVVATSIALDSNGNPHIAYNMESNDGDKVKYALWDGSSWKIEELATNGVDVYLALDSNDNPHIAFRKDDSRDKSRIYYAGKSSGKWNIKIVDSSTIAGGDCGIDIDSNNYPHITYRDYGREDIKYAKWDGTSWNIQTVAVDIGKEEGLRITVDANGRPNIIYSDNKKELLMYAVLDGNSWTKETVNSMGVPSIVIDHLGRVHVSHGYTPEDDENEEREILKYSIRE